MAMSRLKRGLRATLLGMVVNVYIVLPGRHPGAGAGDYLAGAAAGLAWVVADGPAGAACDVAALATARLPPSPAPSATAPTPAVMMIRPSLVCNVPASSR